MQNYTLIRCSLCMALMLIGITEVWAQTVTTGVQFNSSSGNYGIGTSAPGYKLEVLGAVKATTLIGDGSALTNLPSSQWGSLASSIYYNSGNVGIGTTAIGGRFIVYGGNIGIGTTSTVGQLDLGPYGGSGLAFGSTYDRINNPSLGSIVMNSRGFLFFNIDADNNDADTGLQGFVIAHNGSDTAGTLLVKVMESGNVGVGSSVPSQKVDVVGTVRATAFIGDGSALINLPSNQWTSINGTSIYYGGGNVGVGTDTTPDAKLEVQGGVLIGDEFAGYEGGIFMALGGQPYGIGAQYNYNADDGALRLNPVGYLAGTSRYRDLAVYDGKTNLVMFVDGSAGNVGIGNDTTPDAKFEVQGGALFGSEASGYEGGVFIGLGTSPYAIGAEYVTNTDTGALRFNYVGYQAGVTRYRDLIVYDGKSNPVMFVDGSGGAVGIGTTVPSARLTLGGLTLGAGDAFGTGEVYLSDGNQYFDFDNGLVFRGTGATWAARFTGTSNLDPGAEILGIYSEESTPGSTNENVPSNALIATFLNNGNVGVNSSVPSQKLDVVGTIKATRFVGDGSGITGVAASEPSPATLTVAGDGSIATDASASRYFRVTLNTDCPCTLSNPTNPTDGMKVLWEVVQAVAGSETLAYGNKFVFGTDVAQPTITITASKRDFVGAVYNSSTDKWYVIAVAQGY